MKISSVFRWFVFVSCKKKLMNNLLLQMDYSGLISNTVMFSKAIM